MKLFSEPRSRGELEILFVPPRTQAIDALSGTTANDWSGSCAAAPEVDLLTARPGMK